MICSNCKGTKKELYEYHGTHMPCWLCRGTGEEGKPDMPPPDGSDEYYHIRECDNRLRVVVSDKHTGMMCVSLEFLSTVDNRWTHYPGTSTGYQQRRDHEAADMTRQLYYRWRMHLLYMGASVTSVEGLHKDIVNAAEEYRMQQIEKSKQEAPPPSTPPETLDCPECGHKDVLIDDGKFTRHATFCALNAPECEMTGRAVA